ncbi:hypothetical protein [Diaminobutyricibacter sp. McL0608]|uniref:hypothetical protein n=1 Tax=Leifsonia sp. McL0608 TaxID=3143537 RepID=UPI0031F2F5A1
MTRQPAMFGLVRGISFGLFGPPDEFAPQAAGLGAELVRVYLYWSQIEPRPGEYDWRIVDALLDQVPAQMGIWVTVCSSSPWGTRQPTDFQPQSPAVDDTAYESFVAALVQRAAGRIAYWQCNNEVSNTGILWAGTAEEYGHQLKHFARAVRRSDPRAHVVLAGCGYDALSGPPDSPARAVYETLLRDHGEHFDTFALNLYGDPYAIPENVAWVRGLMRRHRCERRIIVGEYNGPTVFEFPQAIAVLEATMAAAFAGALEPANHAEGTSMSLDRLAEQVTADSPDRIALRGLYADPDSLPAALRMFMHDPPADLDALRDRIACRQLVQRAVLILSTDIDTLVCWSLAPEIGGYSDPLNIMDLMFGTLALMDYRDGRIAETRPEGLTHRLMATRLGGATSVERIALEQDAAAHVYRVTRGDDSWGLVAWAEQDDPLDESQPTIPMRIEWPFDEPDAVDVFGSAAAADWDGETRRLRLELTATPIFVTERGR